LLIGKEVWLGVVAVGQIRRGRSQDGVEFDEERSRFRVFIIDAG
jgi:hypothetical protein